MPKNNLLRTATLIGIFCASVAVKSPTYACDTTWDCVCPDHPYDGAAYGSSWIKCRDNGHAHGAGYCNYIYDAGTYLTGVGGHGPASNHKFHQCCGSSDPNAYPNYYPPDKYPCPKS